MSGDDLNLALPTPAADRGLIVVWGIFARMPYGGVTWQAMHHIMGLRRLGFDVWYVEDSDSPLYDPRTHWRTMEFEQNVRFLERWMDSLGMGDRWIFRPPGEGGQTIGADEATLRDLYARADLVLNLCGSHEVRAEHAGIERLAYVQTDPVELQVGLANGDDDVAPQLDAHHFHFTYGENLGGDDCPVPLGPYRWLPTRPPVVLDWWTSANGPARQALTTIANWRHEGKDVVWEGHRWHWSKDREFRRFQSLPSVAAMPLELALGSIGEDEVEGLRHDGWNVTDSIGDPLRYRDYIVDSAGEFTVAKEQYVAPRSGWFSDRSACYLAAGRPVVTQDTGFGKFIPTGEGLFAYSSADEAAAAIEAIAGDYERHSAAAREIAREHFDAQRLLERMLAEIGVG
jgi:Glycosyl transferases group 1